MKMKIWASRKRHQWAGWLFAVVVLEVSSVAAGQTIFQYPDPSVYPSLPPVQLSSGLKNPIDILHANNITCPGDFSTTFSALLLRGLNSTSSTYATGRCLYRTPVSLLQSNPNCAGTTQSVTSFSTTFHVHFTGDPSAAPQDLAFIFTNDSTTEGAGGDSTTNNQDHGHNFAVQLNFSRESDPASAYVLNIQSNGVQIPFFLQGSGITVQIDYEAAGEDNGLRVNLYSNPTNDGPLDTGTDFGFAPLDFELGDILQQKIFAGFSGSVLSGSQGIYIDQWTFNSNGPAPDYPRNSQGEIINLATEGKAKTKARNILIAATTVPASLVFIFLACTIFALLRRNARLNALAKKYQLEELEQLGRGPQSFKYQALSAATKGFNPKQLLGTGGFGSVYKGQLRLRGAQSVTNIAVKRISATSHQGANEFLAEVKIIGQVQHRNLVRVLGWCHERGELLLVYDYMPNGSLDQHLYNEKGGDGANVLTWARRLKIVGGLALALAYLHEEWEQRVIHRDVKSSNVMLDANFNARLGDFGLARLSAHGQAQLSTVLAGTHGYLAPELGFAPIATEKTDVYSFGAVVLEVATGKRPILSRDQQTTIGFEGIVLLDWVWGLYGGGRILEAADRRLVGEFKNGEMETLLTIGLLCSHPDPDERPSMREVLNIWTGSSSFPPVPISKPVPTYSPMVRTIPDDSDTTTTDMKPLSRNYVDSTHIMSAQDDSQSNQYDTWELPPIARESRINMSALGLHSRSWTSKPLPL